MDRKTELALPVTKSTMVTIFEFAPVLYSPGGGQSGIRLASQRYHLHHHRAPLSGRASTESLGIHCLQALSTAIYPPQRMLRGFPQKYLDLDRYDYYYSYAPARHRAKLVPLS